MAAIDSAYVLSPERLADLLRVLTARGYRLVGPTVRDGVVVYGDLGGLEDLPRGYEDEQHAGRYRLHARDGDRLFGCAAPANSCKPFFFVPRLRLFTASTSGQSFGVRLEPPTPQKLALVGVRSCDVAALAVQDRVLLGGPFVDPDYAARREDTFIVAVDCTHPADTCFCPSMGTGPRATRGFDLALTEVLDGVHRFVVRVGSSRGAAVLEDVPCGVASAEDQRAADAALATARQAIARTVDTTDIQALLYRHQDSPRWAHVAERCLSCTNCTLVCPTCFCVTVEDSSDIGGERAERHRRWDSCFTLGHSYMHGGSVHASTASRYRQWLTHKLASWIDQFGTSGCVGCGRCITWCPAAIDLTAEVAVIRAADAATSRGARP